LSKTNLAATLLAKAVGASPTRPLKNFVGIGRAHRCGAVASGQPRGVWGLSGNRPALRPRRVRLRLKLVVSRNLSHIFSGGGSGLQ